MRLLERDLSLLLGEAQGGAGLSPAVLSGVLGVMERHGLRPPRALLLLSRTLLTLEGTLRLIDPEFDLAAEASKLVDQDGLVPVGTPEILRRELVRALPALRPSPSTPKPWATSCGLGAWSCAPSATPAETGGSSRRGSTGCSWRWRAASARRRAGLCWSPPR